MYVESLSRKAETFTSKLEAADFIVTFSRIKNIRWSAIYVKIGKIYRKRRICCV